MGLRPLGQPKVSLIFALFKIFFLILATTKEKRQGRAGMQEREKKRTPDLNFLDEKGIQRAKAKNVFFTKRRIVVSSPLTFIIPLLTSFFPLHVSGFFFPLGGILHGIALR